MGRTGVAYQNRSDLTTAGSLQVPMQAATGQQYGRAGEQMAAQRAVPISRPATDAVPQGAPPAAAPGGAPGGPLPGQVVPLNAPSARPNEPVTAGLPVGAGAGPEALSFKTGPAQQYETARDHIGMLASADPNNDALQYLAVQLGLRF